MSRIGNKAIKLEDGATYSRNGNIITISGPKGTLTQEVDKDIK